MRKHQARHHKTFILISTLTLAIAGATFTGSQFTQANSSANQARIPAPQTPPTDSQTRAVDAQASLAKPAKREPTEESRQRLIVPEGFSISVYAEDLDNPRIMAAAPNGGVYFSERMSGRVTLLQDTNNDGSADSRRVVASGLNEGLQGVHGLYVHERTLFMVTDKEIYSAPIRRDGSLGERTRLGDNLPGGGQHPNKTLAVGPDSRLYVSVGSTCNACEEPNDESATILRMTLDGKEREVYAKGLRNTIGFGWHPVSNEFWGMDHNSDMRGTNPPEELNRIERGAHYGWPWCYGEREIDFFTNAEPPDDKSRPEFCTTTQSMVMGYTGHSAPMQMVFYQGDQFPAEFRNDAFVAMRGSWNRNPPVGYRIVRIVFDENNQPTRFEDFATGWLLEDGVAHQGRITGLAVDQSGALLVSDDENGIIYRITYSANQVAEQKE